MKDVNLSRPAMIADLLRYPAENPISVSDEDAERLEDAGALELESDGLDDKKVAELRAIASAEKINLGNAQTQSDIVASIRSARADRAKTEKEA